MLGGANYWSAHPIRQCLTHLTRYGYKIRRFLGTMLLLKSVLCSIVLYCVGVEGIGNQYYRRDPKFLFLFPFYRVLPGLPCTTNDNLDGICLSQRQCNARAGVCAGNCGYKGVCCVFKRTCGEKTNANNTYFFSPNYSAAFNGGKRCSFTIEKMNSGVCQIRIDFLEFSISEPDPKTGSCENDKLSLGIPNNPVICGENGGHHVYLDFPAGSNGHTISVSTVNAVSLSRRWNLKISQIACNSSERAPPGCLKYFTADKGSDRSFNFSPLSTASGTGNRVISGMNYGVCVRRAPGFCSITWSRSSANAFTFTMSGASNPTDTTGAGGTGLSGSTNCKSNFIIIPNSKPSQDGAAEDRYCGNNLSPVTTSSGPFVMTVVTSYDENNSNNRGFLLEYSQNACVDGDK
ncbi:uncharacterized protein LOC111062984 [Nilaparvata lugens]|uniref:uncharacterized protein LOC111062984 n=1 Tax=Nilaparvata lugens TaxID=108931 RepID=UPI00193D3CD9|nr:uncharacterized protein LOC111062984 [Nilaparvata lugens]